MKDLYNYKQVESFALIGLHNLLNSANKDNINLTSFKMFLEPLERLYTKKLAEKYANKLLKEEKQVSNKKQ